MNKKNVGIKTLIGVLIMIPGILFVQSCDNTTETLQIEKKTPAYISIMAREEFNNDPVRISLDGVNLVDKNITTDLSIGTAWVSGLKKYDVSLVTIETEIKNFNLKKSLVFQLKDTMTVSIRFDRIKKIIYYDTLRGFWTFE